MADIAPTLLLGIGGLGGKIVNAVYGRVPPASRGLIGVHALDTDVAELNALEHLRSHVTATSGRWRIGDYIENNDTSGRIREWFPHEFSEIRAKDLTKGAGQLRSCSRLALRAAIQETQLQDLRKEVERLCRERGAAHAQAFKIMIVGSLAGGTGSGIFLQIALYLRDLLETEFATKTVMIFGSFLLPDTLIMGEANLPRNQFDNIRANAYASLKELDAITCNARKSDGDDRLEIELEYKPGQVDRSGQPSNFLRPELIPYDFLFLYDYENSNGKGIGSFENYKQLVEETVYCQMFRPLGDKQRSIEDNQILNLIRDEGRNRYGSAGVSVLRYPYEDLLSYCSLKWTVEGISKDWLKLDQIVNKTLEDYKTDKKNGVYRKSEPDARAEYIKEFEIKTKGENSDPFLNTILQQITPDQKGSPRDRAQNFLHAIQSKVNEVIGNDSELAGLHANSAPDSAKLLKKEHASEAVERVESVLKTYRQKAYEFVANRAAGLVQQILWDGWDSTEPLRSIDDQSRYKLGWLVGRPALHPIAVRYLLCVVRESLRQQLNGDGMTEGLRTRTEAMKQAINGYDQRFNDPDTPEFETASSELDGALSPDSGLKKIKQSLFNSELKEFAAEYQDAADSQRNQIKQYVDDRLLENVLGKILATVGDDKGGDGLLTDLEVFFTGLNDVASYLGDEAKKLAVKHDDALAKTPVFQYVMASRHCKEAVWKRISEDPRFGTEGMPAKISGQILESLYKNLWARSIQGRSESLQAKDVFNETVLPWSKEYIEKELKSLDISVVAAIRKEAEIAGRTDVDQYITEYLNKIDRIAVPFINASSQSAGEGGEFALWALCEENYNELGGQAKELLSAAEKKSEYSKREIIRYRPAYGYFAQDFDKFSAGDGKLKPPGTYFQAYQARVKNLKLPTPHLDKRWHRPSFLPDLNNTMIIKDKENWDRAFFAGLIYGRFDNPIDNGVRKWLFVRPDGSSETIKRDGQPVVNGDYQLYSALGDVPSITDAMCSTYLSLTQSDGEVYLVEPGKEDNIANHQFIKGVSGSKVAGEIGAKNIFERMISLPRGNPKDPKIPDIVVSRLFPVLCSMIKDYYVGQFGSHREFLALKEAKEFSYKVLNASPSYKAADGDGAEKTRWDFAMQKEFPEK